MNEAVRPPRIAAIDVARGLALIAMAIFHGGWDVAYNHIARIDPGTSPGWTLLARLTAGTFLVLVGISLVLSTRGGIRWNKFWRREVMIVGAAALVSAATFFVLPDGWIFFGILHEIALASLVGLLFVRLPFFVPAIVAIGVFLLPFHVTHAVFANPALWWVGLAPTPPESFDYVPFFPWFGDVLVGIALAKLAIATRFDAVLARWKAERIPWRWLGFAGRHSLAIYLIHQPILFGLAYGYAALFVPNGAADSARADCVDRCSIDNPQASCTAFCGCVFDTMKSDGWLQDFLANRMAASDTRLADTAGMCTAKTLPPVSDTQKSQ